LVLDAIPLKESISKMSLRGAKRRSNPRKSVENKEIPALPTVVRNDQSWSLETDSLSSEE